MDEDESVGLNTSYSDPSQPGIGGKEFDDLFSNDFKKSNNIKNKNNVGQFYPDPHEIELISETLQIDDNNNKSLSISSSVENPTPRLAQKERVYVEKEAALALAKFFKNELLRTQKEFREIQIQHDDEVEEESFLNNHQLISVYSMARAVWERSSLSLCLSLSLSVYIYICMHVCPRFTLGMRCVCCVCLQTQEEGGASKVYPI